MRHPMETPLVVEERNRYIAFYILRTRSPSFVETTYSEVRAGSRVEDPWNRYCLSRSRWNRMRYYSSAVERDARVLSPNRRVLLAPVSRVVVDLGNLNFDLRSKSGNPRASHERPTRGFSKETKNYICEILQFFHVGCFIFE